MTAPGRSAPSAAATGSAEGEVGVATGSIETAGSSARSARRCELAERVALEVPEHEDGRGNERRPESVSRAPHEGDDVRPTDMRGVGDHGRAACVEAAPAGPPEQLGDGRGLQEVGVGSLTARDLVEHDGARRQVDPDGERLGGEDDLDEAGEEGGLDHLPVDWQHSAVVGGDAQLKPVEPRLVPDSSAVVEAQGAAGVVGQSPQRPSLLPIRQMDTEVEHLLDRPVAARPAEDEPDGGQHPVLQGADQLLTARCDDLGDLAVPQDPVAPAERTHLVHLRVRLAVDEDREEEGVLALRRAERVHVTELNGSDDFDDQVRGAVRTGHPGDDTGGVGHGGREAYELYVGWCRHDDLLPHRPALGVA
jgi:hypothetical protein